MRFALTILVIALAGGACGDNTASADAGPGEDGAAGPWTWSLPPHVPAPVVPEDNPMTHAKVQLGRHIFYDDRLSGNGKQSCASCHLQERGFAEDRALSQGSTGDVVPRNAPGLQNVAYNSTLTWLNPNFLDLETQIPAPIFGEFPTELGVTGNEDEVMARFRDDETYQRLFAAAFPEAEDPFQYDYLIKALASFVRSMVSFESPYDREKLWDDDNVMTESEKRGFVMTQIEKFDCFHCHQGFQFALGTIHESSTFTERGFFNTGLYNIGGSGDYPSNAQGLYEFTGNVADKGKFRAQTLRNIMLTAPYMHDGSVPTIDDVLDIYARGGRLIADGPMAGDGAESPFKNEFVHGFDMSEQERADLKAFFASLTDESFLSDPRFSNPWQ